MSTLFDKLYNAGKEAVKAAKQPLEASKLKRKFDSAIDSAKGQKIDAEVELQNLRSDIVNYDLNKVLALNKKIVDADATIAAIEAEKSLIFGEVKEEQEK